MSTAGLLLLDAAFVVVMVQRAVRRVVRALFPPLKGRRDRQ